MRLTKQLVVLNQHHFRARWQQQQLSNSKEMIKTKSAVIIDYAENYVCAAQDEIQSAHWVNESVTIHPIQVYINASETGVTINNPSSSYLMTANMMQMG